MKKYTEKVVCYITHQEHLLVITHVDVPLIRTGVQVPAGTIEPGETPIETALREGREETGLENLQVVGVIASDEYDISPARHEVQRRTFVHLVTEVEAERIWPAGESNPDGGGTQHRWVCWFLPFRDAHVLAVGQGRFIHRLLPEEAGSPEPPQ